MSKKFTMRQSGILATIEKQKTGGPVPPIPTPGAIPQAPVKGLHIVKGAIEPPASIRKQFQDAAAKNNVEKLDRVKCTYIIDRSVAEAFEEKTLSMKMKGEKSAIVEQLLRGYLLSLEAAPKISGQTTKSVKKA